MASITTSMPDTHKRFYLGAENVVQKKKEELQRRKRCLTCWHPKHLYCICKHTPTLNYKLKNIKFIIYMHYLEYFMTIQVTQQVPNTQTVTPSMKTMLY